MRRIPTAVDLSLVRRDVESLQYRRDQTGIEMSYGQGAGIPQWATLPGLAAALDEVERFAGKAKHLMVNRLAPGVEVPTHTDADGGIRWHLPVVTNPDAKWWDEQHGTIYMDTAWWGPVPYAIPHRVWNYGDVARIHVVVDVEAESGAA